MSVTRGAGCNGVSGSPVSLGIAGGIGGYNRIRKDIPALYSSAQDCIDQAGLRGARCSRIAAESWQRRGETSAIRRVVNNARRADGSEVGDCASFIGPHLRANEIRDGDTWDDHDNRDHDQELD